MSTKRPLTSKKQTKKVGFDLQGTKIGNTTDGLDQSMLSNLANKNKRNILKPQLLEFRVEKAREFESYKQIPKFDKPKLAVIHPSPTRTSLEPRHKVPSHLNFDGAKLHLQLRRSQKREIPDHLIKPEIDQEKLEKLRAHAALKLQEEKNGSSLKKVSLTAQKAEKELIKAKSEVNIKIKGAERNIKQFFVELKKLLDKTDEDVVFSGTQTKVEQARYAQLHARYCSFIYQTFQESKKQYMVEGLVNRQQFVTFVRNFFDISEIKATDIFMLCLKKLHSLLLLIQNPYLNKQDESFNQQSPGFGGNKKDNNDLQQTNQVTLSQKIQSYGMTPSEINDLRLDMAIMDQLYQKWLTEDQDMAGIKDPKVATKKNKEFRNKTKAWVAREAERRGIKNRNYEHGKKLLEFFTKAIDNYTIEKEKVQDCKRQYYDFQEDMKTIRKTNKIINNFLVDLPEPNQNHTIKLNELDAHLKTKQIAENQRIKFMQDFITTVKQECVIERVKVSFFDIPELIIKKQYTRKDYEKVLLKLLQKIKLRYLARYKQVTPDKEVDKIQLTDEDYVPFEVFDDVIGDIERKSQDKISTIQNFIKNCQQIVQQKYEKLNVDSQKMKAIAEQTVLALTINEKMESANKLYFTKNFIHRHLFITFAKNSTTSFLTVKSLIDAFQEIFKVEQSANRYHATYKDKLKTEMERFNGDIVGSAETNSEMTAATKLTKASAKSAEQIHHENAASRGNSPDRQREGYDGSNQKHTGRGEANQDDENLFDPNPYKRMEEEDEAMLNQPKPQADPNDLFYMHEKEISELMNPDPTQAPIDRFKKYGVIDKEGLLYDKVTTSYPAILPTEHYQKFIQENLPKKEDGNGQWFIRPHHLETLTKHPLSIKDDVLNMRYVSHYNQDYGKKIEINPSEQAITKIESHLQELRNKMQTYMMEKGESLDIQDKIKDETSREGLSAYEKFITDKNRFDSKKMIIEAYEGVLTHQRQTERLILNKERKKEYDKNRPPEDKWYMLKNRDFSQELYRNRVALKPNNLNAVYLEILQDTNLY